MSLPMTSAEVLNREFLEIRAKLLELAACLDRLQRAAGPVPEDNRTRSIAQALQVLADADPGRAERIQQLFSRDYDPHWRRALGV